MQALTQYITGVATPKATTSGFWYTVLAFWTGPNMTGKKCIAPLES